jgi:hypothetical protein
MPSPTKAGWRVGEWAKDASVSRAYVYILLKQQKLRSVKSGAARIILTSPSEYLEGLADEAA